MLKPLVVSTGAGFTTTSSLLSWLIYGLVTYPGMQGRLLQELVDNGFYENIQMDADLISKLSFLNKYIKETRRRHRPSYQPARTSKVDMILPDRWDSEKVNNMPNGSYIPFATGPRGCIGFNFAPIEVKVFLPKLIHRYSFSPVKDYPIFQLIRPNDLYVRAERRVKWPPQSDAQ